MIDMFIVVDIIHLNGKCSILYKKKHRYLITRSGDVHINVFGQHVSASLWDTERDLRCDISITYKNMNKLIGFLDFLISKLKKSIQRITTKRDTLAIFA